jgi:glycosyltransferase involved in cell wall biosynthesis
MSLYSRYVQQRVARTAAVVVTVSECARRDIAHYLGVDRARIRVIYQAPGAEFDVARLPRVACAENAVRGQYILGIASADPRKNIGALIRAYAALPVPLVEQYRLLLVWTHNLLEGEMSQLARTLGVDERIECVSAATPHDLAQLYRGAQVFAFPSWYEGCGLPPLEAMACGTPVVASNRSSLPEILGDAPLFVDPSNPAALAEALTSVLSNDRLRIDLARRGVSRARQFSWETAARKMIAVYEDVANGEQMYSAARVHRFSTSR